MMLRLRLGVLLVETLLFTLDEVCDGGEDSISWHCIRFNVLEEDEDRLSGRCQIGVR